MKRLAAILALIAVPALAVWFGTSALPASADVAPSPCSGNICTGAVTVGGRAVTYAYTQHLSPNGEFRIRFNGGSYNTGGMVSFILSDLPSFSTSGYVHNAAAGALAMADFDVNPGRTAYERRDANGCINCVFDHVMSVRYSGLAPGTYAFTFTVIQYGESGGVVGIPIHVDAGAPSNDDESATWGAVPGMGFPCADGIDDDLDFSADCADLQCAGEVGLVASGALCQASEADCDDEFDNDADGETDCDDEDCDGLDGDPSGAGLCQYGNEFGAASCVDGFDNDGDGKADCVDNEFDAGTGGNANTICWKKTAYSCPAVENCATGVDDDKDMSYASAWDASPTTGINCADYDCAGDSACPARENQNAGGTDVDAQCFNGLDDDLDGDIDCADADCLGVYEPGAGFGDPQRVCFEKEYDPGTSGLSGSGYQYCGNDFDDDGDGPRDCADSDCGGKFGNCGPCPAVEDLNFAACADGIDQDVDGTLDCADPNCAGRLGSLSGAAMCGTENDAACADGFDNDTDGLIDCADPACAGATGPDGGACQPAGESACADGRDNDTDGLIDCADDGCVGVGSCAPKTWTEAAACVTVPRLSSPLPFTGASPTVTAVVQTAVRVGELNSVRIVGSASYPSVTVIVGDATLPTSYYPYAADAPDCELIDTGTGLAHARFDFTAVAGRVVQIYSIGGGDVPAFDITLRCATPATPAVERAFPVSLSAVRAPDEPEYGDLEFTTTLHENTAPSVIEIEPEGQIGTTISVPYAVGDAMRRFRVVPSDPGVGPATSGICACEVEVDGDAVVTDASCLSEPYEFFSDTTLSVRARTEDGADNQSAWFGPAAVAVNVIPAVQEQLEVAPAQPFFRDADPDISVAAEFITGLTDTFGLGTACKVFIRDENGNEMVNGPMGAAFVVPAWPLGLNSVRCQGTRSLKDDLVSPLADGRYFVSVSVTDDDMDGSGGVDSADTAETERKAIYQCNAINGGPGVELGNGCQYADFDRDGASEGRFTTLYSTEPRACDNCVGYGNAGQEDHNANGIGDACEPNDSFGRCSIDRDIVCKYDAQDALNGCPGGPYCCPTPAFEDPAVLDQVCADVWGICSVGGEVCFGDAECDADGTGGFGVCQDGSTPCKRDVSTADSPGCEQLPGTPLCTGADRCEESLTPWLETLQGNVFSGKKIIAGSLPPQDRTNATYCVTAKDTIVNFTTSAAGTGACADPDGDGVDLDGLHIDPASTFSLPDAPTSFASTLGKIDVDGLRSGRYGTVVEVAAGELDSALTNAADQLGGRVFLVTGDATVDEHQFRKGLLDAPGAGTILIDGGDLTVTGDITYIPDDVDSPDLLPSVGWIVLKGEDGEGGNVYIDQGVTTFSGAVYSNGDEGFWTVAPPATESAVGFTHYGLVMAREFRLGRAFKSKEVGSERFIYDGRAVANPPPGFADVTRSLPTIGR